MTDPLICTEAYGNYAEMDLGDEDPAVPALLDGLEPGNSGGDQEMITEEAGPADVDALQAGHGGGSRP